MKKALILSNFLLFTSCIQQTSTDYSTDFIVPDIKINGDEKFINFDSDYIFDQKSLHTFELKIPGSALKKIDKIYIIEDGSVTSSGNHEELIKYSNF